MRLAAVLVAGTMRSVGLDDNPFDWRATKDGQLLVSRGGRVVTVLRGRAAAALAAKLDHADPDAAQQLLARATGNYRRGNERTPTRP